MKYCPSCGSELIARIINNVERQVCPNDGCGFIFWNNPTPVVAALIEYNGNYIIARNVAWPKRIFSVITGYLEKGETPEEAVIREVEEELGLKGEIKRLIGNYSFQEKNQVILCYEVSAKGKIVTNHELAEIKQLSAEELAVYDFSPLYVTEKIIGDWHNIYSMEPKV